MYFGNSLSKGEGEGCFLFQLKPHLLDSGDNTAFILFEEILYNQI